MGPFMNAAEQTEIWDRYEAGETATVIAAAIGRPLSTVWGLVKRHGHRRPPGPPAWSSARLSLADREEISRRLVAGDSLRAIARCLGRAPSTISREVCGNGGRKAYRAVKAEDRVRASVKRPKVPRLAANTALAELVEEKLGEWWSPEQIAGWLRLEHPDDPSMWVSHETIYRSLYADDHGVLRRDLWRCLRTRRAARQPKTTRSRKRGQGTIKDQVSIHERPASVEARHQAGHWEGDLMVGTKSTAVATLVERKTRFLVLAGLDGARTADRLNQAVAAQLAPFPGPLRRTLTWDQGKEIARHQQLRHQTGLDVYLCDPRSPWQRGTNENTNGLLRQYLPRRTDLYALTQQDFDAIAASLNNRPRRVLGWRTPRQALEAASGTAATSST